MESTQDVRGANPRGPLEEERRSSLPVRTLAASTAALLVTAQILTQIGGTAPATHDGPWSVVLGQTLWNAAQAGLLILLLGLWLIARRWWVAALGFSTLATLPFAIYAVSPGALILSALALAVCATAWLQRAPDLSITIGNAAPRSAPAFAKLEFLGFACMLLCSMYNYNRSDATWPHWATLYAKAASAIGFTAPPAAIADWFYAFGATAVAMPPYISAGREGNNLGALIFLLIWTVLPALYILYFAACAKLASGTKGARWQQALCLFGIVHFLFLTDIVAYQFGRGVENPLAEWAHWSERFAWRIAILLPVYQKLAAGHWCEGNGRLGIAVHYFMMAWAAGFLVYQVLFYDVVRFSQFATGRAMSYPLLPVIGGYKQELGYHGALVLMTFVYGFMLVAMRCKRISATPVTTG